MRISAGMIRDFLNEYHNKENKKLASLFSLIRNTFAVFGGGHLHSCFEMPHKMQRALVSAHFRYLCNGDIRCGKKIL